MPDLANYFPFYISMEKNDQPEIYIDPKEEIRIVCRIFCYRLQGYYRTAEKLRDACRKAGNNFSLADVNVRD